MNINIDNYEEYFLLYADNELSQPDKELVETFVRDNSDLKDEFLMIQRTVIFPDDAIKIADKSFLLKKGAALITENNYEEVFVLYYDNELSTEQKKETENFAEQNIKFKTEFELTGKAKLSPDNSVVYPWKKQLYRKEKYVKIIPLAWVRYVAAAVLTGFGLWLSVSYFNKNDEHSPAAITINKALDKTIDKMPRQEKVSGSEKTQNKKTGLTVNSIAATKKTTNNVATIKRNNLKEPQTREELIAIKDPQITKEVAKPNLAEAKRDVTLQLAALDKPLPLSPHVEIKSSAQDVSVINVENKLNQNADNIHSSQPAYYNETNSQNYVFYDVTVEGFRKSKVGSFLKKVKRVVERSNPIARLIAGNEEKF